MVTIEVLQSGCGVAATRRAAWQRRPTLVKSLVRPLVVALACSLVTPALGAAPAPKTAAAHVQKGREALAKKSWDEARKELVAAWELAPDATTAYLAGRAFEGLASVAEAAEWYERALAEGKLKPGEAEDAKNRLAALRKRPVTVTIDSTPDGATVRIDGKEIAQKTPFFVHLAPGPHHIVAEHGSNTISRDVEIAPLKSASLQLEITGPTPKPAEPTAPSAAPPPVAPPAPPSPEVASPTTTTESTVRVVPPARRAAYITAGAAVVALGFGTVYGIKALRDESRYDEHPTDEGKSLGKRDAVVADVSLALGLGLAITSAVLWVKSPAYETITIAPVVGKGTGGVAFAWSF